MPTIVNCLKPRFLLPWLGVIWLLCATGAAVYDYGGILPYTQWWLLATALPLAALQLPLAIRVLRQNRRALWFVGLILAGLLAAHVHRFSLPFSIARWCSPGVQRVRAEFAIPSQGDVSRQGVTLGLTSHLTSQSLGLWTLGGIACLIALASLNTRTTITAWLIGFALIAAMLAFYGVATSMDRHWLSQSHRGGEIAPSGHPFGTFINRNNASGVLVLGVCAVFTLLMIQTRALFRNQREGSVYLADKTPLSKFLRFVSHPGLIALGVLLVLLGGAIVISGSRGGLVTLAVTAIAVAMRFGSGSRWVPIGMVVLFGISLAILVQWLGAQENAFSRMESLLSAEGNVAELPNNRLAHWSDGGRAAFHYLLFGSGLGTYRYAYLPVQKASWGAWYVNADNLWLELLVETGVPGACLIAALFWLILGRHAEAARSAYSFRAVIAMLGFALCVALLCSQFFDFGLLLPAMMLPAAAMATATIGWFPSSNEPRVRLPWAPQDPEIRNYNPRVRSNLVRHQSTEFFQAPLESAIAFVQSFRVRRCWRYVRSGLWWRGAVRVARENRWKPSRSQRPLTRSLAWSVVVPVGLLFQGWWALGALSNAAFAMHYEREIADWDFNQIGSQAVMGELRSGVHQSLAAAPRHAEFLRLEAELNILTCRSELTRRMMSIETQLPAHLAWQKSSLGNLRAFLARHPESTIQDLATRDQVRQLSEARDQLLEALRRNPLDDRIRFRLLQMDFLAPTDRAPLISQYLRIRPRDAKSLWELASLVSPEGDGLQIAPVVKHLLSEDPDYVSDVANWIRSDRRLIEDCPLSAYIPENRPDLMVELIAQLGDAIDTETIEEGLRVADEGLGQDHDLPLSVRRYSAARLAMLREDWSQAAELWEEAIRLQPQRTDWKLNQLDCVIKTGASHAALQLAKEYAELHPSERRFQSHIDKLEVKPIP